MNYHHTSLFPQIVKPYMLLPKSLGKCLQLLPRVMLAFLFVWALEANIRAEAFDPRAQEVEITVFVSPDGDDSSTGFSASTESDASSGPLRTIEAAVRRVGLIRSVGRSDAAAAKIILSRGQYDLKRAVVLHSQDSNLIIEGDPSGGSVLYGGTRIVNWHKENEGRFWFADVPEVKNGSWDFRQLFANGTPRPRARIPADGLFEYQSSFDGKWAYTSGGGFIPKPTRQQLSTMIYTPGQVPQDLSLNNAEFLIYHSWNVSWRRPESHDPATRAIHFSSPCGYPLGAFGVKTYAIENIREGMLRPGNWYLDRDNGRIVYRPLPNENPNSTIIEAPILHCLLRVNGSSEKRVSNVVLRNLTFDLTSVALEQSGGFGAPSYEGAVSVKYADNCRLTGLTVARAGGQGVKASDLADFTLRDSAIFQTGASGIVVRRGQDVLIENNAIHDIGTFDNGAVAVNASYLRRSRIAHNDISRTPYIGISIEDSMDGKSQPARNRIEFNRVRDAMAALNDGGYIYLSGKARNSVVVGNVLSGSQGTSGRAVAGLYLDELVEDVLCENNLVFDIPGSVLHAHMTRNNTVRNNIFICRPGNRISFARSSGCVFEHNIVYAPNAEVQYIDAEGAHIVDNLFYLGNQRNKVYPKGSTATLDTDPRFFNPEQRDFRLHPDSPTRQIGFKPFDPSLAGRLSGR